MSEAMTSLMEDVTSSTKERTTLNPPSPLPTEVDVDDENGGPSSVEAQADPSDLSFDLELDLVDVQSVTNAYPIVSPKGLASPRPSTSNDIFDDGSPSTNFAGLFDNIDPVGQDQAGVKVEGAVAGICGFYNFANTCYMNSGLQCLLATPTVVKYFTSDEDELVSKDGLVSKFRPLLQDVWAGDYSLLKPVSFKECLALTHGQFAGAHQHDCQEFLALLLDTMHEELRQLHKHKNDGKSNHNYESECGTSMELHTPHSTEKETAVSMSWLSRHSSIEDTANIATATNVVSNLTTSIVKKTVHQSDLMLQDGTESRGSASPKSYDSHTSSVEDKVTNAIRQLPIPNRLKAKNRNSSSDDDEDSGRGDESMDDDDEAMSFDEHNDDCDTMDSNNSSIQPTCNLVAPDSLKRHNNCNTVRFSEDTLVNNSDVANRTALVTNCKSADFYQKENKTLNLNVLAEDGVDMNNEINFDSEKFSRLESKTRPKETIDNLVGRSEAVPSSTIDASTSDKVVNVNKRNKNDDNNLSNLSLTEVSGTTGATMSHIDSMCDFNGIKRMRLDSSEKNLQHEIERQSSSAGASALPPISQSVLDPARLKEAIEADRYWEKYLAVNDTVVARTFQGQFKSSVICSVCKYVSVNFEPFMYLPLPLPNANVKQVEVVYIDMARPRPMKLLLDMSHADNVNNLKQKVRSEVALTDRTTIDDNSRLQVVEVFDHHISRLVDDWTMLKSLKDDRQVYVIRVPVLEPTVSKVQPNESLAEDVVVPSTTSNLPDYRSCVICMEDLAASELRQHTGCECVMCGPCLERSLDHHLQSMTSATIGHICCPGCRAEAEVATEFVDLDQIGKVRPRIRMLDVPVVSRLDQMDASDNNKKRVVTLGHPTLVSVPNVVKSKSLFALLEPLMVFRGRPNTRVHIALVNAQGKMCSRCIFNTRCTGCIRVEADDPDRDVAVQIGDSIAITYSGDDVDVTEAEVVDLAESAASKPKLKAKLSLEDCLEAFSRPELLDESNPWFCPTCRKNQVATKTLSVWRFPDYLIVYLKRFVFTEAGALKLEKDVEFRVDELDVTPYLSGPLQQDDRPVFNMYGCVCHFGSVYGGHYTAFSRHIGNHTWNYFDDGMIDRQKAPGESAGDYSSAYILFYQRAGSRQDNQIPLLSRKCRAFAMGNGEKSIDNNNINNKVATMGDDDDDDDILENPDLSQIIRSLDTPPPS